MSIPLALLPAGRSGRISSLPLGTFRSQAIRLGLAEGATITVWERIPRGPVVIRRGLQEVALGRNLARAIVVDPE
jgi:ferrous iron transport protein A